MSTTIDQRVVEMRFDNKHFEQNVSTTMSTLDKLKQKLNLDSASKGLDQVNNAAKNVNMTGLGSAVESVSAKFSALQVMGVTALANITNSAVNAGKRIVKSLTIEPVTTGFNEYELKMGSTQTIMASTGETLETVNKYLGELNEYSDKTIYSFKDMTSNIGKITNAGVKLEDAVLAIKGISNEAAVSGANAIEASRAMYNFSQALSAGFVKLIDWKSIENANMATKEFKEQLIQTAVEVGTLKKGADGMYDIVNVISKANATSLNATKNFNDSLGNQWMTTEVLVETLRKYADENTEIGKKASAAATEVKTFTMLMDTLKESAQSGWAQTWEILVGDFNQAKSVFTVLSDVFGGIIGKASDIRNKILESALGKGFTTLGEKINGALKPANEAIDTVKESLESLENVAKKVISGEFGNGQTRFDALTKAGYNYCEIQNKVNESLGNSFRYTKDQIAAQNKLLGSQKKSSAETKEQSQATSELTDEQKEQLKTLLKLSDAEIKAAGYNEDQIEALKELRKQANKLGLPLDEFIDKLDKINGRWLLLNSFKNIGKQLSGVFTALRGAWMDIFPETSIENTANKLFDLIAAFHRLTSSINIVDKETGKLTETGDKIRKTFKGVFAAIDVVATVLSGPLKFAAKIVTKLLKEFGLSALDITAKIGDAIVRFRDKVDTIVNTLTDFIVNNVAEWIKQFKETEFFKTVAEWFADASEKISDSVDNISDKISNFKAGPFIDRIATIGKTLLDFANRIRNTKLVSGIIDGFVNAFGKIKDFFGKFKLPELSLDNFKKWATDLLKIGEKISSSGRGGFLGVISGFGKHLKDNVISWNWTVFKETALEKFVTFWLKTGDRIKDAFEKGKEVAQAIKRFIFGADEVDLPTILSVAEKFLGILVLMKTLNLLNGMVEPFDNITDALNNFAASMKWKAISGAFKSMALALGAFTLCIVVLTQLPDMNKAWQAAGMLAGLMIIMGGVVTAMGLIAAKADSGLDTAGVAFSLLALMGAIVLLVYAIKEIDKLELKDPSRTFNILAGVLLAMTLGVAAISKAGGSSFRSVAAILTMMAALKMLLDVIESYEKFDWVGKRDAIKRVMEMLVGLSIAIRIASGGTKAGASSSGLALAILAMVFSLKIILSVIKELDEVDDDTLNRGIETIATLLGMLTIMAVALSLSNKGSVIEKGQKSVNSFKGLAVALLAVVASIWLLGKMAVNDRDVLIEGGNAVGQILLAFTVMLSSVGLACKGLKTAPLVTMLVGIGLLLAEIAIIIKLLEDIPWQQSLGSASALGIVLLALTGVIFTLSKIDNGMTWGDMGKIAALFGGLLIVISALGLVLFMMSSLNVTNAIGNAGSLSILLAAMTGVIFALSKMNVTMSWGDMAKVGAMFGGLVIVLAGLGLVLAMMTNMKTDNAIANATSLSILLSVMTGVLYALSFMKVDLKATGTAILGLAALGLVVWEIGAILGKLEQSGLDSSAIGAVGALSAMLVVMTGVLAACTGLGIILQNPMVMLGLTVAVAALAALGLVVWEIGAIIRKLDQAGLDGSAMGAVNVISAMLITMTGVLAVCSVLGLILQNPMVMLGLTVAVAALAALGLVVWEIGAIVRKLKQSGLDSSAAGTVDILTTMLTSLVDALKVLTVIGIFGVAAFAGVATLGVLALELGVLTWALSKIKDTETARENVETIILLLASLTSMIIAIGTLGKDSKIAVKSLERLVFLVGKLGILAAAVGLLSKDGSKIEKGLDILEKIAGGLGRILGSFGEGLTSSLPAISENLSGFGDNLGGFITAMNNVDDDIITKAKNLAEAIAALTKGNFLNTLASFGDGTLATLGGDLSKFAGNASDFMTAMSGIKPETATSMDAFATAVGTLNAVCGDNNLSPEALAAFGGSIDAFATCITNASISLNGITDQDVENVKKAAAAGEALAELNKQIPRTGGTWQDIAGSQDLADWGAKISAFADSLVAYSAKVSGTTIDSEAIKSSAEAATAVSDLNASIPKDGGLWQDIAGAQDLASWGSKLTAFADGLISYSNKISGANLDKEAITNSAEAAGALVEVSDALPKEDGWWQKAFGQKNMESFGSGLSTFATGLVAYSNAASQIGDDDVESIKKTGTAMDEIKTVVEKIPKTGGTADWFGSRDINGFGTGITAMANGIKDCITVSGDISDDDITAIGKLKSAITKLEEVFAEVPEVNTEYSANFKTSVGHLKAVCTSVNSMSTAGYDFSGLDSIKTGIKKVIGILTDTNVSGVYEDFVKLKLAIDNVSSCAKTLSGLNGTTYGGVDTLKGAISSLAGTNVEGVISAFSGKAESMKAAVNALVSAMTKGLSEGSSKVSTEAGNIADAAIKAVESKNDAFKSAGTDFITNIYNGMLRAAGTLMVAGSNAGNMAATGAKSQHASMYGAGINLGEGLVNGIKAKFTAAYSAGYALGQKAVQGEKDGQASKSPSKLTIKAGKWLGEGLVIGMERMGSSVYNAGKSMGQKAIGSISNSIRSISDAINTDIDAQPTIRPVMDLSDVRSGTSAISDMLNLGSTVGVRANIGSISSMMNARSQNGVNADVVSAIDRLNKRMDNLGNTTYQVNGVTYDDGSNVSSAIQSLVRYAKIERRV